VKSKKHEINAESKSSPHVRAPFQTPTHTPPTSTQTTPLVKPEQDSFLLVELKVKIADLESKLKTVEEEHQALLGLNIDNLSIEELSSLEQQQKEAIQKVQERKVALKLKEQQECCVICQDEKKECIVDELQTPVHLCNL